MRTLPDTPWSGGGAAVGIGWAGRRAVEPADPVTWEADEAVTAMYTAHYARLVRAAALMLHDVGEAEEIVQDAFVAMHGRWGRLRDPERALGYLYRAVVNRSRSALRHRRVVLAHPPEPARAAPSAEHDALAADRDRAVARALRTLPERQRAALVLRYYGGLSEAGVAEAMGISAGAVKSHTSRAMAKLRSTLQELR